MIKKERKGCFFSPLPSLQEALAKEKAHYLKWQTVTHMSSMKNIRQNCCKTQNLHEYQKYFWNVISLLLKSQSGVRKLKCQPKSDNFEILWLAKKTSSVHTFLSMTEKV